MPCHGHGDPESAIRQADMACHGIRRASLTWDGTMDAQRADPRRHMPWHGTSQLSDLMDPSPAMARDEAKPETGQDAAGIATYQSHYCHA